MNNTEKSEDRSLELKRERVIKQLEVNYAHGNLDLTELENRLEMAVNTTIAEDLTRLVTDLEDIQSGTAEPSDRYTESGNIRQEETLMGVLSGLKRKGKWKPARSSKLMVFMGGVDLDFSEVQLPPGETEIEFFCVMGGIDIFVPPGINIELNGMPIMGGIDNKTHYEYNPSFPTLKIHGFVFMGGVDVKPSK